MAATAPPLLHSIQGELLSKDPSTWLADQADVDEYVAGQSPDVIECRERGRHWWPAMRAVGLVFTEVDENDLFIRRLRCKCCKLAVRTEKWEGKEVRHRLPNGKRRTRVHFDPVAATVSYSTGPNGESYLAPNGIGHISSKQIKRSLAAQVFEERTLAQLRREVADLQQAS